MNPAARENFLHQAEWCERLGSPFTAFVCRVLHAKLDERSAFGSRLLNWSGNPQADALALRACGALNFFARSGDSKLAPFYPPHPRPSADDFWRGVEPAIAELDEVLTKFLDSAPQTNEVARSALLLPGYLEIAARTKRPLEIRELGASAGLNLAFDHYAYDYGAGKKWGSPDAKVKISCQWRGEPGPLSGTLEVAGRLGCDLNPIDASDLSRRARMLAYIWPDQTGRLTRAEAALDLAAELKTRVEAIDAARFAERELQAGATGKTLVLAHTVFWQYLANETRSAIRAEISKAADRASEQSPFAWLRVEAEPGEPRGGVIRLSLWPHGPVDNKLALADFHGQWIEWASGGGPVGRNPLKSG